MALSDGELLRLVKEVEKLNHTVYGNGTEGLDELFRTNSRTIAAMERHAAENNVRLAELQRSLNGLVQERRDDNQRREGALGALRWFKWGLGVIGSLLVIVTIVMSLRSSDTRQALLEIERGLQQLRSLIDLPQ